MRLSVEKQEHSPARWLLHSSGGNIASENIGYHGVGFQFKVEENEELVSYQLTHAPHPELNAPTEAVLIKIYPDRLQMLGRVKLPFDRLAEWATKLIGQVETYHESSSRELALRLVEKIRKIADEGLNPVYKSHDEYLCDMWPDLPWNEEGSLASVKTILAHPDFAEISRRIQVRDGVNYKLYFEEFVKNPHAEGEDLVRLCGFIK